MYSQIPIILKLITRSFFNNDIKRILKYENKSKQFLYYLLTEHTFRFADIYSVSSSGF